jgi:hypothetical protein
MRIESIKVHLTTIKLDLRGKRLVFKRGPNPDKDVPEEMRSTESGEVSTDLTRAPKFESLLEKRRTKNNKPGN